jgi:hypothetical protein
MEMCIIPLEENQLCDWRSSSSAYVMVQQKIKLRTKISRNRIVTLHRKTGDKWVCQTGLSSNSPCTPSECRTC